MRCIVLVLFMHASSVSSLHQYAEKANTAGGEVSATINRHGHVASVAKDNRVAQHRGGTAPWNMLAHPDELKTDELFQMTWAPVAKAGAQQAVPRVSAEDKCASWQGNPICFIESPEHELVKKWIPENATVMEFGGRFGTTTCEIAKKLKNSGRHVTIEPDVMAWRFLENNIKSHNCHAHVLRGAISSTPLQILGSGYGARSENGKFLKGADGGVDVPTFSFVDVEEALGLKIDTLLIDCEGCVQDMMDEIGPKIQSQIQLILIEADAAAHRDPEGGDCTHHCMDYPKFFKFLTDNGFQQMDKFNDCDHSRSGAPADTWCGKWLDHYAFKRMPKK